MTRSGRTTIRHVAARCDVSVMTVSRVVRGIDGVSEKTRARVAEAVREMGYVPNANARALVAADASLIGISLPNLFNDVFADILLGMRRTLHQAGYSSVIDTTDYDPARELDWVDRMNVWQPAALVLTGCDHAPGLRETLARNPVVVLEIWDVTDAPIDTCVGIDHRAAGTELGRYVAGLGYRRPAYIGPPEGLDKRADARAAGLAAAFSAVGAAALRHVAVNCESAFAIGAEGFAALDRADMPDVVFFANDNGAFGGLGRAETDGFDVPGDIGIVGFNGLEITRAMPRPLTTLETPRRQIGVTAAHALLARLNGVTPAPVTALPCRLIPGATTRTL